MTGNWRPRVICHVLWHTGFIEGHNFAHEIYSRLCRNVERPMSRGIGIPVFFHSCAEPERESFTRLIGMEAAQSVVVLPLVDDLMTASDAWTAALEELYSKIPPAPQGPHRLFPVALTDNSYNVSTKIRPLNFLRMNSEDPEHRPGRLVAKISHELWRLLLQDEAAGYAHSSSQAGEGTAPIRLFLSHAKQDGSTIVVELLEYLAKNSPVEAYFDATNVPAGFDFQTEIERYVEKSALLIAHSDLYSSREWCRREVLLAKKYQCPILVVNAILKGEDRSFPYLGNVPTIRWDRLDAARCQQTIDLAVREVLRSAHFRAHLDSLQKANLVPDWYQVLTRPPEILTYVNLPRVGATADAGPVPVIYPDPPLGDEEVALIHSMSPDAKLTTPTSSAHWIKTSSPGAPLKDITIGLSISESTDLQERGMGTEHLQDAMQEFARHILANGGTVAYGGDLRPGGFMENLLELVQTYRLAGHQPWQRIRNYLAWPMYLKVDPAVWARYKVDAMFVKVSKPEDISTDPNTYIAPDTIEHRYAWARSLTFMREKMLSDKQLRARVSLGGRVQGYLGCYPGLAEEAYLTMMMEKPLYLCGGFGGCTAAVISAVKGNRPAALTREFQESDSGYASLIDYFQRHGTEPIDYDKLRSSLAKKGIAGLNNGLSIEDNEILFATSHITQMIYLILKGLANLQISS